MSLSNPQSQSGEHIDTVLGEILEDLVFGYDIDSGDNKTTDFDKAAQAIKNIIEEERTRAKIELLEELEPQPTSLGAFFPTNYIETKIAKLKGAAGLFPPTPVKGERGKP